MVDLIHNIDRSITQGEPNLLKSKIKDIVPVSKLMDSQIYPNLKNMQNNILAK